MQRDLKLVLGVAVALSMFSTHLMAQSSQTGPWKRHTIDASSRGADGIRIADINRDGHPDFVTGWEEGGQIRVCINPGPSRVTAQWPSVLVGKVAKPEDAVFVDLDNDGAIDVVSCCEGKTRKMFVHWAPADATQQLQQSAWQTESLTPSENKMMWMFCLPLDMDGRHGIDLVAGAKGPKAKIGWFQSPVDARKLDEWKWRPIYDAGWIMSLYSRDLDGDGDQDLITTDRKGKGRGCHWLENPRVSTAPGAASASAIQKSKSDARSNSKPNSKRNWKVHSIRAGHQAMFATLADVDKDGLEDIVTCAKDPECIHYYRRTALHPPKWDVHVINWPKSVLSDPTSSDPKRAIVGGAKAVEVGDVDGDGDNDLVCTCEGAGNVSGAFWLSFDKSATESDWTYHEIAGKKDGIKYDIVRLIDLDHDGDLDAVTCEERDNLGVFWYENPQRQAADRAGNAQ